MVEMTVKKYNTPGMKSQMPEDPRPKKKRVRKSVIGSYGVVNDSVVFMTVCFLF